MGAESNERHLRTRDTTADRGRLRCSVRFGRAALAFACSVVVLAATAHAQDEETARKLGEIAAMARFCGYHSDAKWVRAHFDRLKGFEDGRQHMKSLFDTYDRVWGVPCERVRSAVQNIKAQVGDK